MSDWIDAVQGMAMAWMWLLGAYSYHSWTKREPTCDRREGFDDGIKYAVEALERMAKQYHKEQRK